jgi:Ca2+-binding RTX toxin-like protein
MPAPMLGDGNDTVSDASGSSDSIISSISRDLSSISRDLTAYPDIESLVLIGSADINGTGNSSSNNLRGNSGANTLSGGSGDDFIQEGAGSDVMDGGPGTDWISYADATAGVQVWIPTNVNVVGGAATGDTLANFENIMGSNFNDDLQTVWFGTIFGLAGDDTLRSTGSGNGGGTLRGDAGHDTLFGEENVGMVDHFWLQNNKGADTITVGNSQVSAFTQGTDRLRVVGSEFGIGPTLEANELGNRAFDHSAVGTNPQFIYQQNTHEIWFDADGTGSGAATILIATFDVGPGSLSLLLSDFEVI